MPLAYSNGIPDFSFSAKRQWHQFAFSPPHSLWFCALNPGGVGEARGTNALCPPDICVLQIFSMQKSFSQCIGTEVEWLAVAKSSLYQ